MPSTKKIDKNIVNPPRGSTLNCAAYGYVNDEEINIKLKTNI